MLTKNGFQNFSWYGCNFYVTKFLEKFHTSLCDKEKVENHLNFDVTQWAERISTFITSLLVIQNFQNFQNGRKNCFLSSITVFIFLKGRQKTPSCENIEDAEYQVQQPTESATCFSDGRRPRTDHCLKKTLHEISNDCSINSYNQWLVSKLHRA